MEGKGSVQPKQTASGARRQSATNEAGAERRDGGHAGFRPETRTKLEVTGEQKKEPRRLTFFIRPGDKQLYKMSCDWEENLHKE